MRDSFHDDLDSITTDLVTMIHSSAQTMCRATDAMLEADAARAHEIACSGADLEELRCVIDEKSVDLLARQQPVATDLRMVVAAMHMASDIERMGGLARHVARSAIRRAPEPVVPPDLRDTIGSMAKVAVQLADAAASSLAQRDVAAARRLRTEDDAMDDLHRQIFSQMLDRPWPHGTAAAVDVTLIGRYLERFGDHTVQIADRVIYLVTGDL